jgi:hypothetical protein
MRCDAKGIRVALEKVENADGFGFKFQRQSK